MVMADRYVEDIRNGRRFRNASPNGFSEESSDDDERGMFHAIVVTIDSRASP